MSRSFITVSNPDLWQCDTCLPAEAIQAAADVLVDCGWLAKSPPQKGFQVRPKAYYPVNPAIHEATHEPMV